MNHCRFLLLTFFAFTFTPFLFAQDNVRVVKAYPDLSFNGPIDYQFATETDNRVYVAERNGRIVSFVNSDTTTQSEIILDITDMVNTAGEGGLLGFSFHPGYPDSSYLYVSYTTSNPFRSVISRFSINEESQAMPESELILMELEQPFTNHNGGQIQFGPDGYLYIAFGDGGDGGDPLDNGQDPKTLFGSILRIDVDNPADGSNYGIPADNPFVENDQGFREEIYAYGLRNPWRFSFDSETGELWAADVGQSSLEEIDIIEIGGNYGWNTMEGTECFEPSEGCDMSGLELPVFEYGRSQGISVTGGYVYRGSEVPELDGRYLYADFGSGRIWSLVWDGEAASDNQLIDVFQGQIITFGQDQAGEVYFGAFDGNIYTFESESGTPVENENGIPGSVSLSQNYPNPFNPSTAITYTLNEPGFVELRVFSMLGKEIATLVQEQKAAGSHTINFNASKLPSGLYIYQLNTGNTTLSQKMTLIK